VTFTGGANPCNVYWQVSSSATLGSGSTFAGTILASASVTIAGGVTLTGRALASSGNVTLINDTINASSCGASTSYPPTPVAAPPPPPREIYCTPAGVAYDLVAGQNLLPPYNLLGLIPAYVDPVTGAKSCTFPTAIIPVVPTPVAPTPVTPTPVAPTPTSPTPAQKAAAAAKAKAAAAATKKAAAVKAAKKKAAAAAVLARRAKVQAKKAKPGAPPKTATGGFTG
jgi:type VI secretion system secreted protein VgrG